MAEDADSAPSAVSAVALFKACIEGFDIVVTSDHFTEDYEQLCALFSLQRARFGLWGESVGLIPSPHDGRRLRYDNNLDRADIKPRVEEFLGLIKSLLDEARRVDERSGLKSVPHGAELATSRGLDIFKGSFEKFKSRVRKTQKGAKTWTATRWAIHNAPNFENLISRLKNLVDGLESITISLGLLEQQHARLCEEIESISDTRSLRLLRDAASRHSSSQHSVSDTASQRLLDIVGSYVERQSGETSSTCSAVTATTGSFVTANTRPSGVANKPIGERASVSTLSASAAEVDIQRSRPVPPLRRQKERIKPAASCKECLEEHYKCVSNGPDISCARCLQKERMCSFTSNDLAQDMEATLDALDLNLKHDVENIPWIYTSDSVFSTGVPQNQRLLSDLLGKAKPRTTLSFKMGDVHYGEQLRKTKEEDSARWINSSGKIIAHANSGSAAAKRMFLELRDIRAGKVPFISAIPIDDSLDRVLASIEGPPETPYEGGIFWITIKLSVTDPYGPPLMRFHTKIYHPNISPQGHICADYRDKWNAVLSAGFSTVPVSDPSAAWFSGNSKQVKWSLGALLTALCGLLASPDVEDPLVPEIAMKYLEDYDEYCRSARLFTKQWATGPRPDETKLLFLEDNYSEDLDAWKPDLNFKERPSSVDVASIQESLRKIYDDKALGESIFPTSNEATLSGRKSYASRIQEQSPLASRISLEQVEQKWYIFLDSRKDGPLEQQAQDSTANSTGSDLSQLIRISREHLNSKSVRDENVSDTSIWYSLFELASSVSKKTSRVSTPADLDRMIQGCTGPFLNACKECTLDVSETTSAKFYQISISNVSGLPNRLDWVIFRSWDDFRELNVQISDYIPGGELWQLAFKGIQSNWIRDSPDDTVPNGRVMGLLLAFALRILLLLHGSEFLEISSSSKIIAFFRPSGPFDGVTLRKDEPSSFRPAMHGDPLRTINLDAFLPPRLFSFMAVIRVVEYRTPVSICLSNQGLSRFSLLVCSPLNTGAGQSFDLYKVKEVRTVTCPPGPGYLMFSIDCTGPTQVSRTAWMSFAFSREVDLKLWYEVLRLFQRLAPFSTGL
ncbi:hypothetical protein BKA65DRAFT_471216 [Rhexocercosporidium sp. MPI-PUGE-AT-0058]|nr:hypothetical protein BKA65DRAFT_471216 [Rhexocercosporidium sp. MPI-PUGE-AT-0058]